MSPPEYYCDPLPFVLDRPDVGIHGYSDQDQCIECWYGQVTVFKGFVPFSWVAIEHEADVKLILDFNVDLIKEIGIRDVLRAVEAQFEGRTGKIIEEGFGIWVGLHKDICIILV